MWLLLTLAVAYALSLYRVDLFFPALLLMIGGRYLTFQTLYDIRTYWIGGGGLAAADAASWSPGSVSAAHRLDPVTLAL